MIFFPFGFFTTTGSIPVNTSAPSIAVVNEFARIIVYTPGVWEDANTIEFAWYMDDVLQIGANSSTFICDFDKEVKVVETANGDVSVESNTITLARPAYYENIGVNWNLSGGMIDSVVAENTMEDNIGLTWLCNGDIITGMITPIDECGIGWTPFGSIV